MLSERVYFKTLQTPSCSFVYCTAKMILNWHFFLPFIGYLFLSVSISSVLHLRRLLCVFFSLHYIDRHNNSKKLQGKIVFKREPVVIKFIKFSQGWMQLCIQHVFEENERKGFPRFTERRLLDHPLWHKSARQPAATVSLLPCVAVGTHYGMDRWIPDVTAGLIINYYTSVDQNEHICSSQPHSAGLWQMNYG